MPAMRGKPTELRFSVLAFADITPNPLFDRSTCHSWQAFDATLLLHHLPNTATLLSLSILLLLHTLFSLHTHTHHSIIQPMDVVFFLTHVLFLQHQHGVSGGFCGCVCHFRLWVLQQRWES